ncbi:MAG: HAD-IIB family hydrolase [Deltaproteobacteria bacterium]|nr:HAD-IIB family hydrolase [Deltaproteobacteria bacterium]
MRQLLIFTDLDGTLIDHDTYGFKEVEGTLAALKERGVPVIVCSSKTRAEIERLRSLMGLDGPFVVENGGAVFVPAAARGIAKNGLVKRDGYWVKELGIPYKALCDLWKSIKSATGVLMTGFSEMSISQIVSLTGLSARDAQLATRREYSEPFILEDDPTALPVVERMAETKGLKITRGGRFYHLTGDNDKGKAVMILRRLYAQALPDRHLVTVGLGDSANDIAMFRQVDIPAVIQKKDGSWEPVSGIDSVIYSKKPGPIGWAQVVDGIISAQTAETQPAK